MIESQPQTNVFCWIERSLLFLLGFIPFCNINRSLPDPTFWSEWSTITLFVLWLILRHKTRYASSSFSSVSFSFLAASAVVALQTALGMAAFPIRNLFVSLTLVVAFLVAGSSQNELNAGNRLALLRPFCAGLILALALNSLAVLLRLGGYDVLLASLVRVPSGGRAMGLIGQPNHLGVLTAVALGTAIYFHAGGGRGRWVLWPVTTLGAMACAMSGSRIGVLTWLSTISLVGITQHMGRSWGPNSQLRLSRLQLGLILAIFIVVQGLWLTRPHGPGLSDTSVARTDAPGRGDMIRSAVLLAHQHPALGVGYGNYAERRLRDLDIPMFESHATHAHNLFAQALAEWGAVGVLIVIPPVLVLLVWCWRALRSGNEPHESFLVVVWIVSLLAHSMVEYPLWYARWLLPFALMVGLLRQPTLTFPIPTRRRTTATAFGWVILVVAASGYAAWDYGRSQSLASRLVAEIEATGKARVPLAEALQVASTTMFPFYAQIMLARALPLNQEFAEEKLSITTRAMNAIPNAETIARQISFLVLAQKTSEASAMLRLLFLQNEDLYRRTLAMVQEFGLANPIVGAFAAAQSQAATP